MRVVTSILKTTLLSGIALSSVIFLSACGQPTADNTTTPSTAETPNTNTSPVVEVPTPATPTIVATPTSTPTVVASENLGQLAQAASNQGQFTILTKAVQAAGLSQYLTQQGSYTVFAPTDAAFNALPKGTVDNLLKPENKQKLVQLLSYHVVPGTITAGQLKAGTVKTVGGNSVQVSLNNSTNAILINDARVVQADIPATNGIVHVVDKVILPPGS